MKNFRINTFIFSLMMVFFIASPSFSQESSKKLNSPPQDFSEDSLFKRLGVRKMVNEQAPSFTLKDITGKEVSLESLKGKTVFIDFWATWCGPCRQEMPFIEKLAEEFKSQGLVILTVSAEKLDVVSSFLDKNSYKIKSLIDEGKEVSKTYQVKGLPTAFIIDKEGKIITHFIGSRDEASLRGELKRAGIGAN